MGAPVNKQVVHPTARPIHHRVLLCAIYGRKSKRARFLYPDANRTWKRFVRPHSLGKFSSTNFVSDWISLCFLVFVALMQRSLWPAFGVIKQLAVTQRPIRLDRTHSYREVYASTIFRYALLSTALSVAQTGAASMFQMFGDLIFEKRSELQLFKTEITPLEIPYSIKVVVSKK